MGEQGRRIRAVLADVDIDDENECFRGAHLSSTLKFPFASRILEATELLPIDESRHKLTFGQKIAKMIRSIFVESRVRVLPHGTKVTILGIYACDEDDGVLARIQDDGKNYAVPVGNLEWRKSEKTSLRVLEDYAVWLANH
jgi:hypothetical protein